MNGFDDIVAFLLAVTLGTLVVLMWVFIYYFWHKSGT